jgi:hypothetical protein
MSLFFPAPQTPPEPSKPPATTTLTLEKALTDAFIQALQAELGTALTVTAAENFDAIQLPACFVKANRQQESIINSAIFQFSVDITLAVQADDSDPQALESLWAEVLCVAYDVTGIVGKLNSIRPQYCYIYGIIRDGGVSLQTTERHFLRSVSLKVHAALVS